MLTKVWWKLIEATLLKCCFYKFSSKFIKLYKFCNHDTKSLFYIREGKSWKNLDFTFLTGKPENCKIFQKTWKMLNLAWKILLKWISIFLVMYLCHKKFSLHVSFRIWFRVIFVGLFQTKNSPRIFKSKFKSYFYLTKEASLLKDLTPLSNWKVFKQFEMWFISV